MTVLETLAMAFQVLWAVLACAVLLLAVRGLVRFLLAPWTVKAHYPLYWHARLRWRYLTRNLGLALVDKHQTVKSRAAFGPTIGKAVRIEKPKAQVRYPRVRFRIDAYGIAAYVRTLPKAGRKEFEAAADWIADFWQCARVQVSQVKPGLIVVRGLRRDPLADGLRFEDIPPAADAAPWNLYLGRDEWAEHRWLSLSGISGVTVGGLPGYGKTSLVLSLLRQLFRFRVVQVVVIDGKGGGDYTDLKPRLMDLVDDDLKAARNTLKALHEEMRRRQSTVRARTGHANAWTTGPTVDFPFIVVVVDECHTFFDLDAVKGDKERERLVRECRFYAADLVKKGRSVMFCTLFLTQKQTSDAIPTAIRDNCAAGLSFAVKTRDAAVAGLGDAIREYPSYCPTTLRDRSNIGVCTATLPGLAEPFVRLRAPHTDEAGTVQLAEETAPYRLDLPGEVELQAA